MLITWIEVLTYEPEELLGTKLRALYQRKKGRDLFDLSEALTHITSLDPEKVVACFMSYLQNDGRRVTREVFDANVAEKITDRLFLSDVPPLLARGISFDPAAAFDQIREAFISRMPKAATKKRNAAVDRFFRRETRLQNVSKTGEDSAGLTRTAEDSVDDRGR